MTIFWLLKYLVLSSDPLLVFGALVEDDNSPISTAHQPVFLFPRKKPPKWIFYPSSSSSDFFCQTSNLEQANIQKKPQLEHLLSVMEQMFGHLFLIHSHIEFEDGNTSQILVFGNFSHLG